MIKETAPCCCGSGQSFAVCCQKFIEGKSFPQTAEQLMRSRYSAYVVQDIHYLKTTWHRSTCPDPLKLDANLRWIGLEIKNTKAGGEADQTGSVKFVARYKINGRAYRLEEESNFVRQGPQWLYVDGSSDTT